MENPQKAKVFKTGRSQAVRIPLDFRFTTDEVYIRRDPQSGEIILSSTPPKRKTFAEILSELKPEDIPDDFLADRELESPQERTGW